MKQYNIQSVSQLSGVSAHCIRAWEKRYKAIVPARSDNGRRLYSESELNRLLMLGKLSSLGNSIGMIAKLTDKELEEMLQNFNYKSDQNLTVLTKKNDGTLLDPEVYLQNLLMALQFYKVDVITHELQKASIDLGFRDLAIKVLVPLYQKIGHMVQEGKLSADQEHTLSAITRFFIGKRINAFYESNPKAKAKFILATPTGEMHSIGTLLTALILAEHNIDFLYLGEDLPASSLSDATLAVDGTSVVLGVSDHYQAQNRPILTQYIEDLRKTLPIGIPICVGGTRLDKASRPDLNIYNYTSLEEFDRSVERLLAA